MKKDRKRQGGGIRCRFFFSFSTSPLEVCRIKREPTVKTHVPERVFSLHMGGPVRAFSSVIWIRCISVFWGHKEKHMRRLTAHQRLSVCKYFACRIVDGH